jgi:hypothetical protein
MMTPEDIDMIEQTIREEMFQLDQMISASIREFANETHDAREVAEFRQKVMSWRQQKLDQIECDFYRRRNRLN